MYDYRKLTPEQKAITLRYRALRGHPLHAPPHLHDVSGWFRISTATYEHTRHFATDEDRAWLVRDLLRELDEAEIKCSAWVVLSDHYHLLVHCQPLSTISEPLRRVHARTARALNRRAGVTGRQVWYRFGDRRIRDERHYYTTLNYIHYNPVKHGYVDRPVEWACSSVHAYLERFGVEWLRDLWRHYPPRDYGKGWDW